MNDIHPILPPIKTPLLTAEQEFFIYALLGLLTIIILTRLIHKYRKIFNKKLVETKIEEVIEKRDFKAEALEELKQIKQYLLEENFKDFSLALTATLKKFLSGNFKIELEELTTTEIQESTLNKKLKEQVCEFLRQMDDIKFSEIGEKQTEFEKMEELLKLVTKLIQNI